MVRRVLTDGMPQCPIPLNGCSQFSGNQAYLFPHAVMVLYGGSLTWYKVVNCALPFLFAFLFAFCLIDYS